MKVTLYTPDGTSLVYTDAEIDSNLIPDLSFSGRGPDGRRVHVSSTLAYLIVKDLEDNSHVG